MSGIATEASDRLLLGSLLTLTFVSGMIDAASVLGMGHVFTANMTGNVVFLAFSLAAVPGYSVGRSGVALAAALIGGVLAGNLDSRVAWPKRSIWLSAACILETAFVAVAAFLAWRNPGSLESGITICTIIGLTAAAMGLRNGTMRRLGVPDLNTTVLTLAIAGLAFDSRPAGGSSGRWRIRFGSILCMFAGAAVGVLLLRHSLALVLSFAALLSFLTGFLHMFRDDTTHESNLAHR